jgi:hypothetical protein
LESTRANYNRYSCNQTWEIRKRAATRLSNIGIKGGMDGPRLTSAISKLKKVKNRLMEDVRLDSMHATTIEKLENPRND